MSITIDAVEVRVRESATSSSNNNNNNRLLYLLGKNDRDSHADLENVYAYIHRNAISSVHGSDASFNKTLDNDDDADILRVSASQDPRASSRCGSCVVDASGCVPLNGPRDASVRRLRHAATLQVLIAVARNATCYAFAACVAVSVVEASDERWRDVKVAVLVGTVASLVGVVFQFVHVIGEMRRWRPSVVSAMLRGATTRAEFEEIIEQRQRAAPFVGAELRRGGRLSNACCCCCGVSHSVSSGWSNRESSESVAKRLDMVVGYSTWSDESRSVRDAMDARGGTCWVVVGKDYRYASRRAATLAEAEVAAFSKQHGCSASSVVYTLDVDQGADFPDAAAILVHYDDVTRSKASLYSLNVYLALSFCCLDAIYCVIFYLSTRYAGSYYVVKYMDK